MAELFLYFLFYFSFLSIILSLSKMVSWSGWSWPEYKRVGSWLRLTNQFINEQFKLGPNLLPSLVTRVLFSTWNNRRTAPAQLSEKFQKPCTSIDRGSVLLSITYNEQAASGAMLHIWISHTLLQCREESPLFTIQKTKIPPIHFLMLWVETVNCKKSVIITLGTNKDSSTKKNHFQATRLSRD